MSGTSRRKHERLLSRQLADCTCYNGESKLSKQTLGRTLNISISGILLETHTPLETEQSIKVTLGIKDNLIGVEGRIVHSKVNDEGLYIYGIEFSEFEPQGRERLVALLKDMDVKPQEVDG